MEHSLGIGWRAGRRVVVALALLSGAGGALFFGLRDSAHRLATDLSAGERFADSLERRIRGRAARDIAPADAMATLYLERLRLGIGSPFRLVDYAMRDQMLPDETRRLVAEAILARTAAGASYQSPDEALDLIASHPAPGVGEAHRRFIEEITAGAHSPRAAELGLRLAYGVGTASGVVSHRASAVALGAIAQARDRSFAMRDVAALVSDARRQRMDVVDLVSRWRTSRRFLVEQPLADISNGADEQEAVAMLPRLSAGLDSLATAPLGHAPSRSMGAAVAAAASAMVERRAAPPQAPIAVTLGGYASFVVGGGRTAVERTARATFIARARTEESLAAELGRLRSSIGPSSEAGLAVLAAAVAMRPFAQERVWLPGDRGPEMGELQSRLGLASLSFDNRVPSAWRPYYLRMLSEVVDDLSLVFSDFDLTGLNVRFGASPLADKALALHDPSTRTVYFPLATSAGAMAHELAHDLDWQAARRRFGVRGGYRTDRSVRQYRDDFSFTVRRLASAERPRRETLSSSVQADRPTEAFARGVDWFVASALAHRGRMNGYLTSVQDETLTGYASATAPRSGVSEGDATLDALREITTVEPAIVAWYDTTYGSGRRLGVADAVRRTLLAPLPRIDGRYHPSLGFDAIGNSLRMLRASAASSSGWSCLLESSASGDRDTRAMRAAMRYAAQGRAAGIVRRWGDYARGVPDASWRFRALGGGPWDPAISTAMVNEVRDAILWRAARADEGRNGPDVAERASRRSAWERCAAVH